MNERGFVAGVVTLALLAAVGCSKTQDKEPETKIFGQPPVIEKVVFQTATTQVSVACDFTDAFNFALPNALSANVQVAGPVVIGGSYTQLEMRVTAVDPNSVPGKNDILLVSASFVPNPLDTHLEEVTLVLFDDGSKKTFFYGQSAAEFEDCKSDATTGVLTCTQSIRVVINSNDEVEADNVYTRQFALVNLNLQNLDGPALFRDCIAQQNHQVPFSSVPNVTLSFRIDVVDREGNLTTFPQRQTIKTEASTFTCTGDPCLCCDLRLGVQDVTDPNGQCRGLPGLYGPSAPDGFCNLINLVP